MMAKPMKTLKLHYPMIQFLLNWVITLDYHFTILGQENVQKMSLETYMYYIFLKFWRPQYAFWIMQDVFQKL